jgi:hypothetical protein
MSYASQRGRVEGRPRALAVCVHIVVARRGSATVPCTFIADCFCFLQSFLLAQRNPCLSLGGLVTLGFASLASLANPTLLSSCNGDARVFENITAVSWQPVHLCYALHVACCPRIILSVPSRSSHLAISTCRPFSSQPKSIHSSIHPHPHLTSTRKKGSCLRSCSCT